MDRTRNNSRNNLSSILTKIYWNIPIIMTALFSPLNGVANDDTGVIYTHSIGDKDPLIQRIYDLVIKSIDPTFRTLSARDDRILNIFYR